MADIKIIVGYETVTQADQAFKILDKTVKSTARQYEQAFNKITGWQKRFSSEQNRVNASLNTNYLAQQKSNKSARDSARAFEENEKALRGVAAAHELTRKKYVAGAAAGANLKRAQGELSAAYRVGVINIDEYRQALILLNQQNVGNRRSTNNLGVAMQQTGYQVGDFVVQVQSGQNPMVAFGQQATQLVGVMYLLPPATLAAKVGIFGLSLSVSALVMALGIAIPVLTAIGAAYMRFKKNSDTAGKAATELGEKIKSLKDSLKEYKREKIAEGLGITADQLVSREAVGEAKKSLKEAEDNYRTYLDNMKSINPFKALRGGLTTLNFLSDPSDTSAQTKAVAEAKKDLLEVTARLREQQNKTASDQRHNLTQELALQLKIAKFGSDSSQVKSLELEQEIASRHRGLESQRKSLELKGEDVDALKKQVEQTLRLEAANAKVGEQLMSHVKLYQDALETRKSEKKSADELILANENLLGLLSLESQYTKDSVQYRKELVTQERERLETLVRTTGMQQYQADIQLSQFETQMDITGEMSNSADRAKDLADALKDAASAMASLLDTGSLEAKLAGLVAETKAIRSGANSAAASYVAIEGVKAAQKRDTALAAGVINPEFINDTYRDKMEAINKVGAQRTIRDTERDNARGAKKSGGSIDGSNAVQKLQQQIELNRQLVGLSKEKAAVLTQVNSIQNSLGKDRGKYSREAIEGLVKQNEAYKEQQRVIEEAKAQQDNLAKSISSSMGDAFTSIVDGTKSVKDAFKDMARSIIKQLFDIFVVKKITGFLEKSLSGLFGGASANGNVFSGGSQVQAYANGGVVNGPTTFGMSGGKTGLMGEAGPEAIMPLKRGSNGKLGVQMEGGGGDTIVVHQNFNFQSNGDDSIKKLIAQAAPQISAMTKSSLLNDRRRGGATKAAFG